MSGQRQLLRTPPELIKQSQVVVRVVPLSRSVYVTVHSVDASSQFAPTTS